MNPPSMRLVHALIGKSIAEAVLIGALVVVLSFTAYPPYFRGWGEITPQAIAGWAVDNSQPFRRVRVQLFIDGEFTANEVADQYRPDVRESGWARDDWHGYAFKVNSLNAGTHVARVYALTETGGDARQVLQLLGDPLYFSIDERGRLLPIREGRKPR